MVWWLYYYYLSCCIIMKILFASVTTGFFTCNHLIFSGVVFFSKFINLYYISNIYDSFFINLHSENCLKPVWFQNTTLLSLPALLKTPFNRTLLARTFSPSKLFTTKCRRSKVLYCLGSIFWYRWVHKILIAACHLCYLILKLRYYIPLISLRYRVV